MELRTISLGVVYRENVDVVVGRLGFGTLRVEAWRGRHVETFLCLDARCVVDQHERGCLVVRAFDTGGPVGLVAEDQIERGSTVGLCLLDEPKRMVGAEHHRHRFGRHGSEGLGYRLGARGYRNLELVQRRVLVVAAGAGVGADADVATGNSALLRPLPHGRLEQRNRWHKVQGAAADSRNALSDPQCRKGLAGPACHDELATVAFVEAPDHVVESRLLVGSKAVRFAPVGQRLRLVLAEVGPVERSSRADAEMNESRSGFEMVVPGA